MCLKKNYYQRHMRHCWFRFRENKLLSRQSKQLSLCFYPIYFMGVGHGFVIQYIFNFMRSYHIIHSSSGKQRIDVLGGVLVLLKKNMWLWEDQNKEWQVCVHLPTGKKKTNTKTVMNCIWTYLWGDNSICHHTLLWWHQFGMWCYLSVILFSIMKQSDDWGRI